MLKTNVLNCFGGNLKNILSAYDWKDINEIRIRTDKPIILKHGAEEYFIDKDGSPVRDIDRALSASGKDIDEMMNLLSDYSLYAVQEQIKSGFITVSGGHRAALAGSAVIDNGKIITLKNISSVSLRIASEKKDCAKELFNIIGRTPKNILIVSPVCGGKTTMLRDILRLFSNTGFTVGISDERGEIAACCRGVPQLDVGIRTDVLDSCPKALGMSMLVRTMSPDVAAADEIGSKEDERAVREAVFSGVAVICTAHGNDIDDIKRRLKGFEGIFDYYVFLEGRKNPGRIREVLNGRGEKAW